MMLGRLWNAHGNVLVSNLLLGHPLAAAGSVSLKVVRLLESMRLLKGS